MDGRREAVFEDMKAKNVGFPKTKELEKTAMTKIMALLSDEQRSAYQKMVGESVSGLPQSIGTLLKSEPKKDKEK